MASADVTSVPKVPIGMDPRLPADFKAIEGSIPQSRLGWLRPTPADTPIEEIRRRLEEDEYVFVKGLLPREDVLETRRHYFSQFKNFDLLKPGTSHTDGIYNSDEDVSLHNGIGGGGPGADEELRALVDAHVQQPYLDFVAHPKLRGMVRDLMGWDEEVMLTRTMLRHNIPGGMSTGIHYDKLFLRGGDAFFLTAWVPIGDISPIGGGLFYLENGVELAKAIEEDFNQRARSFSMEEKISAFNSNMSATGVIGMDPMAFEEDSANFSEKKKAKTYRWLVANYEAGDVVFHHPYSIHSAGGNFDPGGRIRLSTDLRFYDKKDHESGGIDERWMKFWTPADGL
ncbi:hypothetical protein H2204_004029 [Knufia peltigerae]|uniref:Phytanoyl-CoA dioxygenase n=1 Tax=Knufia peltigerae TaxID=1002370 RepID=A0AA38Y8B0_9EURO|nr:hypothetical protein H2204_004029 [Knufia peltigerae]